MLSPPKFTEAFESESICDDKSSMTIHEEEIPCSPQTLLSSHRLLLELLREALVLLEGKQIAAASRKLEELSQKIQINRATSSCKDRNFSLKGYWRIQLVCYYHLAYAYEYLENSHKFFSTAERAKNMMEKVQKLSRGSSYKNTPPQANIVPQNLFSGEDCSIEGNLKLYMLYVKLLLATCLNYSKIQNHEKAYFSAKEGEMLMTRIFVHLLGEPNYVLEDQQNAEKIKFKQIILKKAFPIVKRIVQNCEVKSIEESQMLKNIKSTVSTWKKNPQQGKINLKFINQSIPTVEKKQHMRSILGVRALSMEQIASEQQRRVQTGILSHLRTKRAKSGIIQIIQLQNLSFKEVCRIDNKFYEISEEKMFEKLEILCAIYFSLGVQLHCIQNGNIELMKSLSAVERFKLKANMKKSEVFPQENLINSELYFLKSIQTAYLFIAGSDELLDQLIDTYQRKFEGEFQAIEEENSKYEKSCSLSSSLQYSAKNLINISTSGKIMILKKNQLKQEEDIIPQQVYYQMGSESTIQGLGKQIPDKKYALKKSDSHKKSQSSSFIRSGHYKKANDSCKKFIKGSSRPNKKKTSKKSIGSQNVSSFSGRKNISESKMKKKNSNKKSYNHHASEFIDDNYNFNASGSASITKFQSQRFSEPMAKHMKNFSPLHRLDSDKHLPFETNKKQRQKKMHKQETEAYALKIPSKINRLRLSKQEGQN